MQNIGASLGHTLDHASPPGFPGSLLDPIGERGGPPEGLCQGEATPGRRPRGKPDEQSTLLVTVLDAFFFGPKIPTQ